MGFKGEQKFAGPYIASGTSGNGSDALEKYFNKFADSWTFARAVAERYAGLGNEWRSKSITMIYKVPHLPVAVPARNSESIRAWIRFNGPLLFLVTTKLRASNSQQKPNEIQIMECNMDSGVLMKIRRYPQVRGSTRS
jgi:hypothetical protein